MGAVVGVRVEEEGQRGAFPAVLLPVGGRGEADAGLAERERGVVVVVVVRVARGDGHVESDLRDRRRDRVVVVVVVVVVAVTVDGLRTGDRVLAFQAAAVDACDKRAGSVPGGGEGVVAGFHLRG